MHANFFDRKSDSLRCWSLLLLIIFVSSFWAIAVGGTKTKGECSKEEETEVRELLAAIPGEWWSWTQTHVQLLRNICVDIPGTFRAGVIERLRRPHIDKQFVIHLWKYFFDWDSWDGTENRQTSKHKYGDELGEGLIQVCLSYY